MDTRTLELPNQTANTFSYSTKGTLRHRTQERNWKIRQLKSVMATLGNICRHRVKVANVRSAINREIVVIRTEQRRDHWMTKRYRKGNKKKD